MFTKNRGARGTLRKTLIFRFWTASITLARQFGARAEKSWFLNQKCSGSFKIIKSEQLFYSIVPLCCSKPYPKPWFFGKSSMGTLEKSQNVHEKSMSTRYFAKNMDFKVLNGFDHIYEAIRSSSWKIVIFEPKMLRIAQNHQKWTGFLLNRLAMLSRKIMDLYRKCCGSVKIADNLCLFSRIVTCNASEHSSEAIKWVAHSAPHRF